MAFIGTIDGGVGVDIFSYYQFSPVDYLQGPAKGNTRKLPYYAYAASMAGWDAISIILATSSCTLSATEAVM